MYKHTKEQCPNPDKAKVEAARKQRVDQQKRKEASSGRSDEKRAKTTEPAERGFYSYMKKLDNIYGQETPESTFIAKIVEVKDRSEPLSLNILLQKLGVSTPFTPVEKTHDE